MVPRRAGSPQASDAPPVAKIKAQPVKNRLFLAASMGGHAPPLSRALGVGTGSLASCVGPVAPDDGPIGLYTDSIGREGKSHFSHKTCMLGTFHGCHQLALVSTPPRRLAGWLQLDPRCAGMPLQRRRQQAAVGRMFIRLHCVPMQG